MLYDFTYQNPTRIHFGRNAMDKLQSELGNYGDNVLLIYGKVSIKKFGIYSKVIETFKYYSDHNMIIVDLSVY